MYLQICETFQVKIEQSYEANICTSVSEFPFACELVRYGCCNLLKDKLNSDYIKQKNILYVKPYKMTLDQNKTFARNPVQETYSPLD